MFISGPALVVGGELSLGPASSTRFREGAAPISCASLIGQGGTVTLLLNQQPSSTPNPLTRPFASVSPPIVNFFSSVRALGAFEGTCVNLRPGSLQQNGNVVSISIPLIIGDCPLSQGALAAAIVGPIFLVAIIVIVILGVRSYLKNKREIEKEKAEALR